MKCQNDGDIINCGYYTTMKYRNDGDIIYCGSCTTINVKFRYRFCVFVNVANMPSFVNTI